MGKNNKINIIKDLVSGGSMGIKNFIIPAVDILVAERPEFIPAWILAKGFFGFSFDIQQDKINEFVRYIKENPSIFTKEIVDTKDFREGFVITFESYIKQRNDEKRKIVQEIFLGFTRSTNKVDFELERMYDLLDKISISDFKILKALEEKQKVFDNNNRTENYEYERIKYLEYLGLVSCEKEQEVEVETEYESSDASFIEREIFSISYFGYNFIKFLKEPTNK